MYEDGECGIYERSHSAAHVPLRLARAKTLLGSINKHFDTLPFCRRYLDRYPPSLPLFSSSGTFFSLGCFHKTLGPK